jgi:hypothetical protein
VRAWAAGVVASLVLAGCSGDDEIEWVQFNTSGDTLLVGVGTDEAVPQSPRCTDEPSLCEGLSGCICLRSSLSAHDVGTAIIDPTHGPVNTRHTLAVEVLDEFEDIVQRVSVVASGPRGEDELELRQDSADPGSWRVQLESLGAPDEVRTDTLEVRLWEPEGVFSADEEGS